MLLDRLLFAPHLHAEEKLLGVVHSHFAAVYRPAVQISFFGLLLPVVFWLMFPTRAALYLFGAWFLAGLLRLIYTLIDWYFDVLLITTEAVVDLDWRGFFSKSSTRLDYESVIGVTYDKPGFFANVLDFGPLTVEREGHGEHALGLPCAAHPAEAEEKILGAREKFLREKGETDSAALKDILSQMIAEHIRKEREKGELSELF